MAEAVRDLFDDDQLAFLLQLHSTPAPSGFEGPAVDVFGQRARALGASWQVDASGNGIATFNEGAGPRVMVTGHLDEIGFIVTSITDTGLLGIMPIGGWDMAVMTGHRVIVLCDEGSTHRPGAIARTAIHEMDIDDADKSPKFRDLWVDCGFEGEDEARSAVRIGDPIVLHGDPVIHGSGRLMSRSVDDRIGAFIALEAAAAAVGAAVEIAVVGAAREEIAGHSAEAAATLLRPVEALAIDVCTTSDVPGTHEEECVIDGGPAITFGAVTCSRIGRELLDVAREIDVPVQLLASGTHTATDADEIVSGGTGTPVGLLNVPTRHLHTPGETCSLLDVRRSIDLVAAWLRRDRAGR